MKASFAFFDQQFCVYPAICTHFEYYLLKSTNIANSCCLLYILLNVVVQAKLKICSIYFYRMLLNKSNNSVG